MTDADKLFGVEELRRAVNLFDNCNEGFNQQFTAEELLILWRMYCVCGWDFAPDEWTDIQVENALNGIIPTWDKNERPMYPETP